MTCQRLKAVLPPLLLPALVAVTLLCLPRDPSFPQGGSREVIDEAGRHVRFSPGGLRALYMAMGAGEYLLTTRQARGLLTSRSPTNERLLGSSLLRRSVPNLGEIELGLSSSEGAAANLETLLLRRPEVLITWNRLVPRFERVGITAVGLGPVSAVKQFHDHARLFDSVAGTHRSAGMVARSISERRVLMQDVTTRLAPRTRLLVLYPSGTSWRTNYDFPEIVAAAGGYNPLSSLDRSALDVERMLAVAPEVIVISGGEPVDDDAAALLMADPRLASIPAVAQRRVYRRPPGLSGYMNSAIEVPIYQRWLAEVLHPDDLAPIARPMAAEVIRRELGTPPTEGELDAILGVRANRSSAHHARFERSG